MNKGVNKNLSEDLVQGWWRRKGNDKKLGTKQILSNNLQLLCGRKAGHALIV